MQHKALLSLAVTVATLVLSSSPARASGGHHDVEEKRWAEPSFVLEILETAPDLPRGHVVEALGNAAATWNGVGAGPEIQVARAKTGDVVHPVELDGKNRVGVWQDGAWPYPPEAGAVTVTYSRKGSGVIAEVDIALNPAFAWTMDTADERSKYDLENVLVHELGHALGLPDLKKERDASMFYMILRGETLKRDLSREDEGMLLKLYEGIDLDDTATGCNASGKETPAAALALLTLIAAMRARRSRPHAA